MKLLVLKKSKGDGGKARRRLQRLSERRSEPGEKPADYAEKLRKLQKRRGDTPGDKLEHFRKLILEHLDTLDGDVMKKAGLPVGTIHDRKDGQKYIKTGPNKWVRKYESHSRGAKMAVAAIRRKIAAAKDAHEMMSIVLEHRDRFSGKDGQPLPFVQELHNYVMSAQEGREKAEQKKAAADKKKDKPAKKEAGKTGTKGNESGEKSVEEWEQTGADAFKAGKTRKPPYDEIVKTGIKIGSPESKEADKKMKAWLRGWDKADAAPTESKEVPDRKGKPKPGADAAPNSALSDDIGLNAMKQQIEQQRKERNSQLSAITKDYLERLEKLDDEDKARSWLASAKAALRDAKGANLGQIKRQYDYSGGVEIGDNILYSNDIPDRVSPKDIKQMMVFNAQTIVDAIQDKIKEIKDNEKDLFDGGSGKNKKDTADGGTGGGEKSDFEKIREKYAGAKSVTGDGDEIAVGDETLEGKWKLVEADAPAASHDESTFHKTKGFPVDGDGGTVNDRDYEHDDDAKNMVVDIGTNYDMRALSFDNPVVVTQDGIVISGNNRTMSSKIAARKGTDKKYIEALKKRARKFGFSDGDIAKFKNPRVVFEVENKGGYDTGLFAKFNQSGQKSMNPIEKAVKVSKMVKTETVEKIASKISEFDTLGDLYQDPGAITGIFNHFSADGIIGKMDMPQYVTAGGITGAGKEFMETVLIGSVINEQNIRRLNREGCKSIRQKLVRAITPLIENRGMKGYSVNKELNEAVDISMQIATDKNMGSVADFAEQDSFFEKYDPVAIEIAKKLEGTQKSFAAFMQTMNGGLKYAANGEADIFLGGVESKDDILARMLNMKKAMGGAIDAAINGALRFFHGLRKGRGSFDREKVIINRAGENIETWRRVAKQADTLPPPGEPVIIPDRKKTVAVDFDGVINSYKSGWKGPTETDEPVVGAAHALRELFELGHKIIVFSTRANTPEGEKTIRDYIMEITETPEIYNSIEITDRKPVADVYIDDRAIPFAGDWKEILKQIDEFKPWTEQARPPISNEIIDLPDGIYEGLRAVYEVRLNNGVSFRTIDAIKCSWNFPMKCKVEIASGNPYWAKEKPAQISEDEANITQISDDLIDAAGYLHDSRNDAKQKLGDVVEAVHALTVASQEFEKSLTWSGFPLQGRTKVQGMDISIENKKGSTRSGTDKDGHEWHTKMSYDYGYIRGTVGTDKDHLDAYVGPNPESEIVYIVNQNDPVTGNFDEQKVMLGFSSEADAKAAYLKQYDRPGFLGSIVKMDIDTFKEKAFDVKNKGKPLKKADT
ncbi:MAG: hypothetical protein LBK61_12265 [Spirochaetaceae bacterium]|jgi:hypothetical protein|nr:hypothetical protein [Spirochaetaceae bacterium]